MRGRWTLDLHQTPIAFRVGFAEGAKFNGALAAWIATVGRVSEFELEPVRVRVLPHEASAGALVPREARTAAIAAVGGVLAGAATVAVVRAVGAAAKSSRGSLLPGRKRQPKVVASRSFLVDVHLLGR